LKKLALVVVLLTGSLMVYVANDLPDVGDSHSPAGSHLSTHYITKAVEETHVPNLVTAVLGDYRGFDTMFETVVIFVAAIAVIFLLRRLPGEGGHYKLPPRHHKGRDVIIKTVVRVMAPVNALFALYVVAHGHHSPGGGFQGGVILGASLILLAIAYDLNAVCRRLRPSFNILLNNLGALLFILTGVVCMFWGDNFLDYSGLDALLPGDKIDAHSHAILLVETGVAITVMSVMFSLYADLSSNGQLDEGL
jgi:multicomponent Na+:H+ antiporter subunit B